MCDEADESNEVHRSEFRRARRAHSCFACGETIAIGDRHHYTFVIFDREPSSWRHCMRCSMILDALMARHRGTMVAIDVGLNCGEIWRDPPPEIEELAFALPRDFSAEVTP